MNEIIKNITNTKLNIKHKKYTSIIGLSPSKGARSPKLWNSAFRKYGIKNEMVAFDVKNNKLFRLLKFLNKDKNFIGGCITVPYKEKIFKLLKNNITKVSKNIGAVNCLFRDKQGRLTGTNTDGEAALKSFENKFGKVKNKNILLLGPGGAGKAVASYFSKELKKKSQLTLVGRSSKAKNFSRKVGAKWINFKKINNINFAIYDIVINCTSIGFLNSKKKSPLSKDCINKLSKNTKIFDIIYQPKETKLIKFCKAKKIRTMNGLEMNLIQAVLAFNYTNKKLSKNSLTQKYMRSA